MTTSDKLLSVLGLFSPEKAEWTVESAANVLDLPVSTAYRYFRSLNRSGLIVAFATGRYVLGPAIIQYDRQMRLLDPLITTAQPIMSRLTKVAPPHSVVLLCRLYGDKVMCVHQECSKRPDFAISYERGRPMPLFRGAASKIILANLPLRTVKGLHTRYASEMEHAGLGGSWEAVKKRLRDLRAAGTAITQAELDVGMAGISAPIFGPSDDVIGSLSIVTPARNATPSIVAAAMENVRDASAKIHWALALLASGHAGAEDRATSASEKSSNTRQPKRTRTRKAPPA